MPIAQAIILGTAAKEIIVLGQADGYTSLDAMLAAPITSQLPVDLQRHVLVLPDSSGTTGLPKGVMLSHRNLVLNVDQIIQNHGRRLAENRWSGRDRR